MASWLKGSSCVHSDLRNRHYREWLEFLEGSENWPEERIREYQLQQLRAQVARAFSGTRGYKALYEKAGFLPSVPLDFDSFRRLPLTEKETFRDQLAEFTVSRQNAKYVTTGGSTGIPFGFYRDNVAFARELASKAHQYHRIGWREGDRQLVFRGLAIHSKSRTQFYPRFNELRCSSYHLTADRMERYRLAALQYQPQWLRCYPSSGAQFAQYLLETKREFPRLQGVLCASENLYDNQKELLKQAFGCRIFSHYGHYELAVLAGFCERADTYHVLPQYGYAELLDKQGRVVDTPGEVGEIVATSFIMKATPFIRYRTRDYAVFLSHGCPECGRPYQVWQRIEGRLQEFLLTGKGRLISMTAMNMHDNVFDHIKQFQFEQTRKGEVTFHYIPRASCSPAIVADMKQRLLKKLGDDVKLEACPVETIAPTQRGKHRFLIQHLPLAIHNT